MYFIMYPSFPYTIKISKLLYLVRSIPRLVVWRVGTKKAALPTTLASFLRRLLKGYEGRVEGHSEFLS